MDCLEYWRECISDGAQECDLELTADQLTCLAKSAMQGHECYGMAYYSPPSIDRIAAVESEWKARYDALQSRFDSYCRDAEKAVGQALGQHYDANVSIGKDGEVFRHGGRTERIQ